MWSESSAWGLQAIFCFFPPYFILPHKLNWTDLFMNAQSKTSECLFVLILLRLCALCASELIPSLQRTSQQWQVHLQGSGLFHSDASQFRIRQTHQVQEVWHYWNRQITHTMFWLWLGDRDFNLGINCRGQVYSTEKVWPKKKKTTAHSGEAIIKIGISDNLTFM